MALIAPVFVIEIRERQPRELRPMLGKQHKSLRITIWKRPKQDSIDDAEHRGIRSDAQRQREHSHQGKSRIVFQPAKREPKILCESKHLASGLWISKSNRFKSSSIANIQSRGSSMHSGGVRDIEVRSGSFLFL